MNKKLRPKSEQPGLNSILILSLLLFVNLISLSVIVELTTNRNVLDSMTSFWNIGLLILIIIVHFLIFNKGGRYKKILLYSKIRSSEISSILYFIFSVLLYVVILILLVNK